VGQLTKIPVTDWRFATVSHWPVHHSSIDQYLISERLRRLEISWVRLRRFKPLDATTTLSFS
jgi:hypothetical protein